MTESTTTTTTTTTIISTSTTSTTSTTSSTTTSTNTSSTALKKCLSFRPQLEQILYIETIDELPTNDIWFTADDYFDMKARGRYDAKEWRKQGFGLLLKETYQSSTTNITSTTTSTTTTSTTTASFASAQDCLNAFCALDETLCRRGMERHCSRAHGEQRSDVKDRARYTVLSNQRRMKRQNMAVGDLANHLALLYHDASRPAKLFARRMALADAAAAAAPQPDNTAAWQLLETMGVVCLRTGKRMERRFSNLSIRSGSTYDSLRSWGGGGGGGDLSARHRHNSINNNSNSNSNNKVVSSIAAVSPTPPNRCPGSPATAREECYAAMA